MGLAMGTIYKVSGRKYWQLQYLDANGKRVRQSSGTTDKTTANQLLVSLEVKAVQTRAGTRSKAGDMLGEYAKQPIQKWLDDFVLSMQNEHGLENEHVADTKSKLEKILGDKSVSKGCDFTSDVVVEYTTQRQKKEKLSARTVQSYVVAAKSFTRWCVETGRLLADPLLRVKSPTPSKDRRYIRRAITREEWTRLRAATESGPARRGMTGTERALLYELALVTGLRAKEITGLTRSTVVLDTKHPYLMLPAAITKNNKPAEQLLTPRLADGLRDHVARKMRGVRVFHVSDLSRLAKVLRADIGAARDAWIEESKTNIDERNRREASDFLKAVDSEKRKVDFHALRYTCGAWLALGGIHAKQIQKMMRHSTIRLTLDTYGHLFPEQQDQALEVLKLATA
jgi:integrase